MRQTLKTNKIFKDYIESLTTWPEQELDEPLELDENSDGISINYCLHSKKLKKDS